MGIGYNANSRRIIDQLVLLGFSPTHPIPVLWQTTTHKTGVEPNLRPCTSTPCTDEAQQEKSTLNGPFVPAHEEHDGAKMMARRLGNQRLFCGC